MVHSWLDKTTLHIKKKKKEDIPKRVKYSFSALSLGWWSINFVHRKEKLYSFCGIMFQWTCVNVQAMTNELPSSDP